MSRAWRIAACLAALTASALPAQSPDTDIYLAPLSRVGDSIVVGAALNVTHRIGYDNQPSFTPDSKSILYTVQSDGQTDIWRYDIAGRRTSRVTTTPESEYSATVMPGGARFSAIRVERDSTQRLWSFALDGTDPRLVLRGLAPIGYHAWLDSARLVVFVLGTPSTLHEIDRDGSSDRIVARDVGRAVHRIPHSSGYSYTQRDSAGRLAIMLRDSGRRGAPRLRSEAIHIDERSGVARAASVPPDNEFHVWTPDGVLITATSSVLQRLVGENRWMPVADLSVAGVKNVSRLAVSADGKWLAFVGEPVTP
jgi:Tol biopolymer transport system component